MKRLRTSDILSFDSSTSLAKYSSSREISFRLSLLCLSTYDSKPLELCDYWRSGLFCTEVVLGSFLMRLADDIFTADDF